MAESPVARKTGSRIQGRVHYQKGDLAKSVEEFRNRSREDIRADLRSVGAENFVSLRTPSLTESPSGSPKVGTRRVERARSFVDSWGTESRDSATFGSTKSPDPSSDEGLNDLVPSPTLPIVFEPDAHAENVEERSSAPPNSPCDESSIPIDLLSAKKGRNEILEKFKIVAASPSFGGSPRCCNGCRCVAILARCRTNLLDRYLCLKCIETITSL